MWTKPLAMWTQCLQKAKHREIIEIDELWNELLIPKYLIVWMDNDEVWAYRTTGVLLTIKDDTKGEFVDFYPF